MMLIIADVLNATEVAYVRNRMQQTNWHDGRETAGYAAIDQKSNQQLRTNDPVAIELGQFILQALSKNPQFISFALPQKILSPMFNRYRDHGEYGFHIDNAIRIDPNSGERIRTDISTTLFLNEPHEYEGGELIINDTYGVEKIKLPAGHAVIYPGTSLHRVAPVTQGERIASFFWTQSMVQSEAHRSMLYELDTTIQRLAQTHSNTSEVVRLTGIYHNMIRLWAQT